MSSRLILYLLVLALGTVVGSKVPDNKSISINLSRIQNICLLFLLFVMGLKIGADEKVIDSFLELGLQAIIITLFSVVFSIVLVKLIKHLIIKKSSIKTEDSQG